MPVYQAQLKRTAFRSFAPAAGVYSGASPPRPPPWAGAAAGACAKAEDSVLIVSATAIAALVPKIFRRTVISSPFLLRVVRVTGGNLDHASIRRYPNVAEGWQQQPVHFTLASPGLAELEVDGARSWPTPTDLDGHRFCGSASP